MEQRKFTLRELNNKYQKDFKQRKKLANPEEFKKQKAEEMKIYREKRKAKELLENPPPIKETLPPKIINLEDYKPIPPKKVRGRPKVKPNDIIPLYKRTNKELGEKSIKDYLSKLNVISKLMTEKALDKKAKNEIEKSFEGKEFSTSIIENNLSFFKNIDDVVVKLREKYQNDNSFRTYINSLVVILGRLPMYNSEYQKLAKINIDFSKQYNEQRNMNELGAENADKMISFNPDEIENNIKKLTNINDKVIYVLSVYLLRRLEIRFLKLSLKNDSNEKDNLLVVDKNNIPIEAIFNDYKTAKTHKKQIVPIPDNIKGIIKEYLDKNKIKLGQYVLGKNKDRREPIEEGNFSSKIKKVFTKVYGAEITNRWIRTSYASYKGADILEKIKEFEKDAQLLSHSVAVHKQYVKINK